MKQHSTSFTYQFHKKIAILKDMCIIPTGAEYYRLSQAKSLLELNNIVHSIIKNKEYIKEV